jgi:4-hydroxy-tetrahydrodipicolinate reductase
MRILLIGYGKMGQTIEKIALERGHAIVGKIGANNQSDLANFNSSNTDVAIEFTQPEAAYQNISHCLNHHIKVICGTTGWLDQKAAAEVLCHNTNGAFLYGSNFSIGVNIFFHLNKILAKIMHNFPAYDVVMEEIHHTQKLDAPSGTAITLAEGVLENFTGKSNWVNAPSKNQSDLVITSLREGTVPGTHTTTYTSAIDDIEIKHTAHSRQGFALGAVVAAEWIADKTGVFSIEDMLKFN